MGEFLISCGSSAYSYLKWLSKEVVRLMSGVFFLHIAGKIGGLAGTILIIVVFLLGSIFTYSDYLAESSLLDAIRASSAIVIHEETGEVLAH